ncbi:SsrA-binding protein [Mesomycoplasma lagogenitalium]|uniref:SsrA-binding protein n=1 Tax=Mesomycoplasma lagogenitalium TaxID=171286 RepID=A0ABY8LUI0_9BACT|nr:SsrA-binding protein [Mesomycoplasma lagogenitalium]WGI36892.1 SsrA-binding protein [Mesomycoplasma lagogenitalium]
MPKLIQKNKIVNFDYQIIEKYECGISLMGWEVKSIRAQNVNLKGSFASFKNGELFLSNMHISLYMAVKGDELRARKLLMHKNQLKRIELKQKQQGYTLVPLSIYWNERSKIKIELVLAKGKNKADKRQSEKEKEIDKKIKLYIK